MATHEHIRDSVVEGSIIKLAVKLCPSEENVVVEDIDFTCEFFTFNKRVMVRKSEMQQIAPNEYVAVLDTLQTGIGRLICQTEMQFPDSRKEIKENITDVYIVRK